MVRSTLRGVSGAGRRPSGGARGAIMPKPPRPRLDALFALARRGVFPERRFHILPSPVCRHDPRRYPPEFTCIADVVAALRARYAQRRAERPDAGWPET